VAPPTSPTFPQTVVLDNFNRANGAIGGNWIDQTARFTISANVLVPAVGESYIEWNPASFGANQEAFVTLSTVAAASQEHNLMLKTQGTTWSTGHIEVSYSRANNNVSIFTFTPPSAWTLMGTFNGVTFAAGDQFGARALSDGTVRVYKNGALIGTSSVATYAGQGGRIGLSVSDASSSRFDDFGGGNVSLAPNTPPVAAAVGVPQSGAAPLAVNFSGATSTDADNDSLTFAWTFGDGGTATGRRPSHTYGSAGSYGAILTVSDGRGGTDTASVAISVTPPVGNAAPIAAATGAPQSGQTRRHRPCCAHAVSVRRRHARVIVLAVGSQQLVTSAPRRGSVHPEVECAACE
jgi:PKD repeat protein